MTVSVEFRGNFLLVGREGTLEEIILPNCDTTDQRNLARRGRLIFNSQPHYAGMVVQSAKGGWKQERMSRDDTIAIGNPDAPPPVIPQSIVRGLPNLQEYGLSVQAGTVAARIRLYGGTLEGFRPSNEDNPKFNHPKAKDTLCLSVVWTLPDVDGLDVHMSNRDPIPILATDTVIIYSFDEYDPTPDQLRREREMTVEAGAMRDRDFEWLYQLYASPPRERVVPTAPPPSHTAELGTLTFKVSSCFPGGDIKPPPDA